MEPYFEMRATLQPDYARFLRDHMIEGVYDTMAHGLAMLADENSAMLTDLSALKGHQGSAHLLYSIQVIDLVSYDAQNLALAKGSPLLPAMKWANR